MAPRQKTRYAKRWNRLRYAKLKDYEEEFQPPMVRRNRTMFVPTKARRPFPLNFKKRQA